MKKKYSSFFSTKRDIPELIPEPENRVEGIYPWLEELESSLEETDPVPRKMDKNLPQKLNKDKDKSDKKVRELERKIRISVAVKKRYGCQTPSTEWEHT